MAVEPAELSHAAVRIANYHKFGGDGVSRRLFVYAARFKGDGALIGSVSGTLATVHRKSWSQRRRISWRARLWHRAG